MTAYYKLPLAYLKMFYNGVYGLQVRHYLTLPVMAIVI